MDVVGLAEIAALFGINKQVVSNWRARKVGFPSPMAELKSGPVWRREDIVKWAKRENIELAESQKPRGNASTKKAPTRHAKITAIMNMKGGVGKSTLATNLGWYAAYERDYRVLLVDLDPQFNLSQYILGSAGCEQLLREKRPTVENLFRATAADGRPENLKKAIWKVAEWRDGSCLHLVPSCLELAWTAETASKRTVILKNYLEQVRSEYDLVIVDCAPTESVLSTAAYHAADYVFVPVKPEFLSTIGLPLLLKSMNEFGSVNGVESVPALGGIILNDTMDKLEHEKSTKAVQDSAAECKWPVFENSLSHSESYPAGARLGKPIFMTDKARSTKKTELARVGNEFLMRMGL
ncbi:MAG TPA: ParA family protein [Nitrobacter sp.]|jgi:chromosome partitioning protein|nr:ParA family protein [Nitrobacter sp.]